MNNLEYPCVILEGVTSVEELNYLKKAFKEEDDTKLPFYIKAFGTHKKIGKINISLDEVLGLDYISKDYKISIWNSPDESVNLDTKNEEDLIKLIRI
ncbi:hypothetical protein [uncultured Clostridium sp.]|uniref:hypothetical protein n=1 Tax=uncultured Clostridium sp. TaxID=59620 RepID=UPI0026F403BF|nr:hypothetical protein [uncultured Clostridium sp.]